MDRCIVYLFSDGSFMYGVEYNPTMHSSKGKCHEVIIGRGFSSNEVSSMLSDYYAENYENIFE